MTRSFWFVGALSLIAACGPDDRPGDSPDAILARSSSLCAQFCGQVSDKCGSKKTDCATGCKEAFRDERARCLAARENLIQCLVSSTLTCSQTPVSSAECQDEETFLAACHSDDGSPGKTDAGPVDAGRSPSDAGRIPSSDAGQTNATDAGRGTTPDAGRPSIPSSLCTASASDSACDACTKRKCCSEKNAYDRSGADFARCVRACAPTTSAPSGGTPPGEPGKVGAAPFSPSSNLSCNERCRSQNAAGFNAFEKLHSCRSTQCKSECPLLGLQ